MKLLLKLLINAAALWVATRAVDGVTFTGTTPQLLGVALVFGVLNVSVRPILMLLTFPFLIASLGLFTFVLNAIMLLITSAVADGIGLPFQVSGGRAAFLGALVISIVSFAMSLFVSDSKDEKHKKTAGD